MNTPTAGGWAAAPAQPPGAAAPASAVHARRLDQAENSPRIGQPARDTTIPDLDPDEALAAARIAAATVTSDPAAHGGPDGAAVELARRFGLLDRWLSDFRTLPGDWA